MAKVSLREQTFVCRELATRVGAGISLVSATEELLKRRMSPDMLRALRGARDAVSHGNRLSTALKIEAGFSPLTIALIQAGEEGGRLEEMLRDAATYLERELELRNLISRETLYPKILLASCVLIPLAAQIAIAAITGGAAQALSVGFRALWMYLLLVGLPVLAVVLGWRWIARSHSGRLLLDTFKVGIPLVGGIVQRLALLKFCRALAALFDAGVEYPRAVGLAADSCGNLRISETIRAAVPKLEQGSKLTEVLAEGDLRNALFVRLLQTGEQTGNIDAMLNKAADHYEDETESLIKRITITFHPF